MKIQKIKTILMKKAFYIIAATLLFAFTSTKFQDDRDSAVVNQEHGLYIFTDCKPLKKYQLIETVEAKNANVDLKSFQAYALSYEQLKQEIFHQMGRKKNKNKFDEAQAIIIYPDLQKADVIKFK